MAQEEVVTLSKEKARKMNGQDLHVPKASKTVGLKKASPPYLCKNHRLQQEGEMVFETGVPRSPRSQHLNKPLSFCSSTCLTSLAFIAAGS